MYIKVKEINGKKGKKFMKINDLLKAKEIIQKKLELNRVLLQTIQALKQDEESIQEEIKANKVILKLINEQIKNRRYKRL